jgi:predicted transcriptional regulator of viral defense system
MKPMELLKKLSTSGHRVFSVHDIRPIAQQLDIAPSYLPILLKKLMRQGLVKKLFRGTFALSNTILAGSPLHEFEVAHALIHPSAICCWSAMAYHGLTDQILRTVYLMVPYGTTDKSSSQYTYTIEATTYVIIRVRPELYFGIEDQFMAEIPFIITNVERTLIDGLVRPQYCGGFLEVMEAFKCAQEMLDPQRLLNYAVRYGLSTQKRLGWVLQTLGIFEDITTFLKALPCKNYYPLDVSKPTQGDIIKGWHLRRNF